MRICCDHSAIVRGLSIRAVPCRLQQVRMLRCWCQEQREGPTSGLGVSQSPRSCFADVMSVESSVMVLSPLLRGRRVGGQPSTSTVQTLRWSGTLTPWVYRPIKIPVGRLQRERWPWGPVNTEPSHTLHSSSHEHTRPYRGAWRRGPDGGRYTLRIELYGRTSLG